jgi:UDP-N-acetylmuramoyl-tripeptide--D-alanyl-D-alanine ligase
MKIELNAPLSSEEIKRMTHAKACTAEGASIRYIATHSSEVSKDTLFLAMAGEKTHGEAFRSEVIARGGYLLTEKEGEKSFTVASVKEALFALARAHLLKLRDLKHTVGITGSVGKTTTKEVLRRILSSSLRTHATEGNQNSEIGLPLTILKAPLDTEALILEMGMNHKGELARLSLLSNPDLVIITNIGHALIGNLGSLAAIAEAKKEILIGAKEGRTVLIPANEPLLSDIKNYKTVSINGEAADYTLYKNEPTKQMQFQKNGIDCIPLSQQTNDAGMLSAIAFSMAAGMEIGVGKASIVDAVSLLNSNIFRQKEYWLGNVRIVFDAYNASYESVIFAIKALCDAPQSAHALLLGDMLELGDFADELHKRIGYACAKAKEKIDQLYLFGRYAEAVADGAISEGFDKKSIFINTDSTLPDTTANQILCNIKTESCLWMKGAHGMHMERILNELIRVTDGDNNDG